MKDDAMDKYINKKKSKLAKLQAISDLNTYHEEFEIMANDPVAFIEKYGMVQHYQKGLIRVKLYDHQKDILRSYHANSRNVVHHARQTGITLINALYAFHQAFFNRDYRVVLTSNKLAVAAHDLEIIRPTYEMLPEWYKTGNRIVINNKHEISFENSSSIIAMPCSDEALRGYSTNLIISDNYNYVRSSRDRDAFFIHACMNCQRDGKFIMTSSGGTTNSVFGETWHSANLGENGFVASSVNWDSNGRDAVWKQDIVELIGEKMWKAEYEVTFKDEPKWQEQKTHD